MGSYSMGCPHCRHEKSLFDIVWLMPINLGQWQAYMLCGHCQIGVGAFIAGPTGNGPGQVKGDIQPPFLVMGSWPEMRAIAAPEHVPGPVAQRFVEAEDNFAREKWNSAVAMYRSALDIATKAIDGVPQGQTFFKRLEWLRENEAITQALKDWADHVRVEGNEALHEPDQYDANDAGTLRHFTTMFLRYVFEMPKMVEEFRAADGG